MKENQPKPHVGVVILAAGKGTRMKSDNAKVLVPVAGRPMILYVVDAAVKTAGRDVVVVVGTQAEEVKALVSDHVNVYFAWQKNQLGTGHAAMCGLPSLGAHVDHVVLLCGDVPLITAETLERLIRSHTTRSPAVTVLGAEIENPSGYGRIKQNPDGTVDCIVEETDASEEEKKITTVNTGIYCVNRKFLESALYRIDTDNAQNEIYLTDIVGIAAETGETSELMLCLDSNEMCGINTSQDLEKVEAIIRKNEKP
ncbi:MAG: NTP transferase domain-containing protein [Thermodesulfobacteriota bacterium]